MEALKGLAIVLPYPPSVNHYWRRVGARTLISREGRRYRERVAALLRIHGVRPIGGPLSVHIRVHPPDHRRRDLDNTLKALLDALEHGGAYGDDFQVDHLEVRRGAVVPEGKVAITITEAARNGTAPVPA